MTSTEPGIVGKSKARGKWISSSLRIFRTIQLMPLMTRIALLIVLFYAGAALFAPWIAPYGEADVVNRGYLPPGTQFLLGTDQLGRDVFSRMIFGARNTLGIAIVITSLAFAIGVPLAIFAVLKGGIFAQAVGAVVDVVVAVPTLMFALLFLTVAGRSTLNLVLIIAFLDSARIYLVSRSVSASIISLDFVEAARLRGEGIGWMISREILPNMFSLLAAEFGLRFSFVFLTISALSFLGIGIQPPTADWGSMIAESKSRIMYGIMTPFYPISAIVILTIALNFIIDWLQNVRSNAFGGYSL